MEKRLPLSRLFLAALLATGWSISGSAAPAGAQPIPHATLPECQAGDPDLLLPDLVPDPPKDLRELYSGPRRHMQFTTGVGNIGDGPLLLEGRTISTPAGTVTQAYQRIWRRGGGECARPAGQFEFHPSHRHWHFNGFVGYELRRDHPITGPLVAGGAKTSFCLLDLASVAGFPASRYPRQLGIVTCESPDGLQGISVGWKDVYERVLPGQSINLDPDPQHQVPTGAYYVVNVADPDHLLWETNTQNNASWTARGVSLPPLVVTGPAVPTPTVRPRQPRLRPPRFVPTRAPRPVRPGRSTPTVAQPTPTATRVPPTPTATAVIAPPPPLRPTRAPRPPRPGRGTPILPGQPTPTAPPVGPGAGSCDNPCVADFSQMRLTWYDALGLQVSGLVGTTSCGPLHPDPGEAGTIKMIDWKTEGRQETGLEHHTSFVLADGRSGRTDDNGNISFTNVGGGVSFSYSAAVRPLSRASDGASFPVVFNLCMTVGDQTVKARLVCQPKSTGMLCHE